MKAQFPQAKIDIYVFTGIANLHALVCEVTVHSTVVALRRSTGPCRAQFKSALSLACGLPKQLQIMCA